MKIARWRTSALRLTDALAKELATDLRHGAPITPFRDGVVILDQDNASIKVLCGRDIEREIRTYQQWMTDATRTKPDCFVTATASGVTCKQYGKRAAAYLMFDRIGDSWRLRGGMILRKAPLKVPLTYDVQDEFMAKLAAPRCS